MEEYQDRLEGGDRKCQEVNEEQYVLEHIRNPHIRDVENIGNKAVKIKKKSKVNPCANCFHFKTMLVHKAQLDHLPFRGDRIFKSPKFTDFKMVRIWFCKMGRLPQPFYFSRHWAMTITNGACEMRDE